jgi:hypothetical protein
MQAVLKTNKSSDRTVDDGTFALFKHFRNFMLHAEANPFRFMAMVLSHFPLCNQPGAESPSIPALLKHNQSPKGSYFDHGFTSALFDHRFNKIASIQVC